LRDLARHRLLVTGASGFLGAHVVRALRARGATDLVLPRRHDYDLTTEAAVRTSAPVSRSRSGSWWSGS
jgi:GDP-L-fucose synthase